MSAFNLGSAVYEIGANTQPLGKALSMGRSMIGGFAKFAVASFAAAAVGMGAALAGGIKLTQMGSDLEELDSKFQTVFGDRTDDVKKWGGELANATQRSSIQIRGMLSGFQDLFVPMGVASDQAEHMSKTMSALAIDLGSFNNRTDEAVMEDLQAAMTGSGEVMKKYGVILNETAVKQELLNQGLEPKNATEAQKAMARMNIILNSTTAAHGDAARTADGVANSWKGLTSQLFDLASNMGKSLLPAAKLVIGVFKDMAGFAAGGSDGFESFGQGLADTIGGAIDYIKAKWSEYSGSVMYYFGVVKNLAMTVWSFVSTAGVEAFKMIVDGGLYLVDTVSRIARATGFLSGGFADASGMVTAAFGAIRSIASTVFEYVVAGIKNVIFAFQNWDLYVETIKVKLRHLGPNIVGAMTTAGKNLVTIIQWVGNNWRDIFTTIGDFIVSVATNMVHNIKEVWNGLMDWIAGKEFKPNFKSLTDGFESSIKEMPQLETFTGTDAYKKEMKAINDEYEKRRQEFENKFNMSFGGDDKKPEPAPEPKKPFEFEFKGFDKEELAKASGDATEDKKDKKSDAGSTVSLQAAFDKVQQAAFGKEAREKDNHKNLKTIAKDISKIAKTKAGPQQAVLG